MASNQALDTNINSRERKNNNYKVIFAYSIDNIQIPKIDSSLLSRSIGTQKVSK